LFSSFLLVHFSSYSSSFFFLILPHIFFHILLHIFLNILIFPLQYSAVFSSDFFPSRFSIPFFLRADVARAASIFILSFRSL